MTLTDHLGEITDMLIVNGSRCITSSIDRTLKIWDLGQPSKESCVATLTDIPRIIVELRQLNKDHFLSASCHPNIVFIWQLTDDGAHCTAMLDPDWGIARPANDSTAGRELAYDLPPEPNPQRLSQYACELQVQPDGRLAIQHWCEGVRLCHPTGLHSDPKRVCIIARNKSGAVTRSLPICPVGPPLPFPVDRFQSASVMPDGRTVHTDAYGIIHFYSFNHGDSTNGVMRGHLFPNLPPQYEKTPFLIEWMTVMDDGRLLACRSITYQKSLFSVYDPYAQGKKPNSPVQQEHSPPACRLF